MLTPAEIHEALAHIVRAAPVQFALFGYVSSSTNQEGNLVFEYRGPGLYAELLKESFKQISDPGHEMCQRPQDIKEEDWQQAINEQRKSWAESITGGGSASDITAKSKSYVRHIGGYLVSEVQKDVLALDHLYYVEGTITLTRESARGNFRNDVTKAKALLRERSPLGRYIGLVTLSPSKVAQIQVRERD